MIKTPCHASKGGMFDWHLKILTKDAPFVLLLVFGIPYYHWQVWPQNPEVKSGLQEVWATWIKHTRQKRWLNAYMFKQHSKWVAYLSPRVCFYIQACLPARKLFATVPPATEWRGQTAVHSPERWRGFWEKGLLPLNTSCKFIHIQNAKTSMPKTIQSIFSTKLWYVTTTVLLGGLKMS